ncbi:hypothetical protein GCM10023206_00960 [Acinetobacter puyangensis]|uniref:Uncharacterized protein n=1 Tax=Acinetobacter puyangensis TaxID=1096779 RepID=A0A240E733_9GAMM|nr:hypothetical protein [Acinetobacter puyangensis]SNX44554.1 hypothetical protein SAMN05421731_103292 [Acinetobacter puyangensis]
MNKSKIQNLPSQQGFATILVVLLVGLALGASVLGTAYYLRSSQSSLVSGHALTNVQSGAWNGVEIVRRYLAELTTAEQLTALTGQTLTVSKPSGTNSGSLSAVINNVEQNGTTYLITAIITNISNASKASSKVQVTYEVNLGSGGTSTIVDTTTINVIDIYGDLNVGGGIEVKGGENAVINVHGNFTSSGNTFTGVSELNVTGNVKLNGGGERITSITSNGNVYLGAGSEVDYVYAKGTVTVDSGKQEGEIYANKDIIITNGSVKVANTFTNIELSGGGTLTTAVAGGYIKVSNGSVGTANAQGDITFSGSSATSLISGANITIGNGTIGTAKAKGTITATGGNITNALAKGNILISNYPTFTNITTEQTFYCNTQWWNTFISIKATKISGVSNCPSSNSGINTDSIPSVTFASDEPTTPTGSTKTVATNDGIKVNAYDYLSNANYIFYTDTNGRIKVKVQNVWNQSKSIDYSGDYYLGKIRLGGNQYWAGNSYTGYLCKSLDINELEYCENTPNIGQLKNYIYQLKLFPNEPNTTNGQYVSYDTGSKTWSLADTGNYNSTSNPIAPDVPSLAPGVMFFYGNLNVGQGAYTNTIIATGDIIASIPAVYAPNYAGAGKVCNISGYQMPVNLCSSSSTLTKITVANIALMAGSCTDSTSLTTCKSTYMGGNITLNSNAYIYGNVIAGSRFNTSGASYVAGGITAANLGASSQSSSSFNSKVTIDLTNVDKSTIGNSGSTDTENGGGTNSTSTTASIKWARYL